MTDEIKPSLPERLFGSLLFFTFSVASLFWFISSASSLILDVLDSSPVLNFNKGAMYMFGASIGSFSLFVGIAYHSIFLRKVSGRVEKKLMKGALVGLLTMILFPQATHFGVSKIAYERKYIECHQAGYSWFLYKKYVYTKNEDICKNLAIKNISVR